MGGGAEHCIQQIKQYELCIFDKNSKHHHNPESMVHEYPEALARFYDLIYRQVRDGVDNDFYLNEIRNAKGKVLEIGTGTGRFFIDALNQGADIYGLDISPSMVNVLLKKLDRKQHHRISIQNIIDFRHNYKFDLVIAPFRVIMHVQEKEDQIRALNNVYRHLKPGGRFIFDAFVPDLKMLISGMHDLTDFEGEYEPGKKMRRIVSTRPELMNQLINVDFLIEWDEGNEVKQERWTSPMRYFFRYELEHLIERSDFGKYKILGDFLGNELNEESREFIIICQK
jgi:SAM-dependent methyltransferase